MSLIVSVTVSEESQQFNCRTPELKYQIDLAWFECPLTSSALEVQANSSHPSGSCCAKQGSWNKWTGATAT
ncbi:hypothetical protein AV530_002150 [Patagioenas fasciata monilis]|uniref:Uncharacterized protein n=1 Tax=Patagioenas fasciata monilis TaxID=372326 RepID=A0A1V4K5L2_PATFA|nr:hypothetical protein AV530_002150 [Patagioenas fasciata monilis]